MPSGWRAGPGRLEPRGRRAFRGNAATAPGRDQRERPRV